MGTGLTPICITKSWTIHLQMQQSTAVTSRGDRSRRAGVCNRESESRLARHQAQAITRRLADAATAIQASALVALEAGRRLTAYTPRTTTMFRFVTIIPGILGNRPAAVVHVGRIRVVGDGHYGSGFGANCGGGRISHRR